MILGFMLLKCKQLPGKKQIRFTRNFKTLYKLMRIAVIQVAIKLYSDTQVHSWKAKSLIYYIACLVMGATYYRLPPSVPASMLG